MKIALIILAVIVIIAIVVFLLTRVFLVTTIAGVGPTGAVQQELLESTPETGIRVRLTLTLTSAEQAITTITLPRQLAKELGASAPDGFTESPLAPERDEADDPETMQFINQWNRDNIQWIGKQTLIPDQPLVFVIPATSPDAGTGQIQFQYGSTGRMGGAKGVFSVPIGGQ